MATVSPAIMPSWRIPLKVVTPAQRRGAYSAALTSGGIRTAASERMVQYSASYELLFVRSSSFSLSYKLY